MINITIKGVKKWQLFITKKNKDDIKKKQRDRYKKMSKEEKDVVKERSLKRYYKLKGQYKG